MESINEPNVKYISYISKPFALKKVPKSRRGLQIRRCSLQHSESHSAVRRSSYGKKKVRNSQHCFPVWGNAHVSDINNGSHASSIALPYLSTTQNREQWGLSNNPTMFNLTFFSEEKIFSGGGVNWLMQRNERTMKTLDPIGGSMHEQKMLSKSIFKKCLVTHLVLRLLRLWFLENSTLTIIHLRLQHVNNRVDAYPIQIVGYSIEKLINLLFF